MYSIDGCSRNYTSDTVSELSKKRIKSVYKASEWCMRNADARPAVSVVDLHSLREQNNSIPLANSHSVKNTAWKQISTVLSVEEGTKYDTNVTDYILSNIESGSNSSAWRGVMQMYLSQPAFVNQRMCDRGSLDSLLCMFPESDHM